MSNKLKKTLYMFLGAFWYPSKKNEFKKVKFINDSELIDLIVNEKKSICRYGDGELRIMEDVPSNFFQKNDKELGKRLSEIITKKNRSIIICLPKPIADLKNYNIKAKLFWVCHLYEYRNQWLKYVKFDREYGNTNVTRPYIDYYDRSDCKEKFDNLKRIWDGKNICIIEGNLTKLGVGNDLLNNAKNIRRIIAPSKNAYDCYGEIINAAKQINKDTLILIALGPTATVLAYDLATLGYQALDIGHIDIEYEWFLKKAKNKVAIDGKAVNEVKNKERESINIEDKKYQNSIIKVIGDAKYEK